MKKLRLILILSFGIFMFFGCQKWPEPEFKLEDWVPPKGTMDSQFWPIGPHKAHRYYVLKVHTIGNPPDTITHLNYPCYLRAVVVSSDEGGNYYKSLVVQDTTAGIELQLDMTGLHTRYPVGQKLVIILNGLVVGDYNQLTQIGWMYKNAQGQLQVGRINSLYFDQYIIRDGMPNLKNLPKPLKNNDIDFTGNRDINKLTCLENVTFESNAIGQQLASNHFTTDWKVKVPLANGTTQDVVVRTSNFAKFRNIIIEAKEYNLTGILTKFGNTYQFMLRTREDIQPAQSAESLVFDFTSNPMGEGGWSNQSLKETTKPWKFRTEYMAHIGNPTDSHTPVDDWFISPMITYPDIQNGYLQFEHRLNVENGEYDAYEIYYTTSTATAFNLNDWKPLGKIGTYPENFGWSNALPLSTINANAFKIAFRYHSTNSNIATYEWDIRKVAIKNK